MAALVPSPPAAQQQVPPPAERQANQAAAPTPATRITFEAPGSEPWVLDDLRAASLLANAERDGITDPQELIAAARSDYARILGALYAQAAYGATINILVDGREAADIPTLSAPSVIRRIDVRINAGPIFDFREADIAPLAPGTALPEGFRRGRRAHSTLIQDSVAAATLGWRNAGHAKVDVTGQTITADHAADRLDVDVALTPGPRVTFGRLIIAGNTDVRTARIETIAGLPEGEVYSPDELRDSARRLRRTGAFSSVALVEAQTLGPGDTMDITANVVEQLPSRLGFGGEYNTSEGLSLSAYWMHRNFLGGAENLRFDAEVTGIGSNVVDLGSNAAGGMNYRAGVTYTRPSTITADTDLSISLLAEKKNEEDYTTENLIGNVGLVHYFSDTLTGRVGVEYGTYKITEFGVDKRYFEVLSLPAGLTWDRRDDELNPRSGFYLDGEAQPFFGAASTGAGARLTLDARGYWTPQAISQGRFTLAGRGQIGAVTGPDLIDTPRDFLFYSGGGGTVRGQPYQSLGVPNPSFPDATIGGRSFIGLSGELRTRVTESWGAVAFYDAGYIGENSYIDDTGGWQSGAGIGARYNTGIGPIRFDVAMPVSGDTGGGVQIYVGIGQAF